MTIKELMDKLESSTDLSTANEALSDIVPEEPAEEPVEEPKEEPVEEPVEEPAEEPAEEPVEEPTAEPVEEKKEEGYTPEEEAALSIVAEAFQNLAAENKELKKQIADIEAKLAAKTKAEADFFAKFKNLSASVADEKEEKPVVSHQIGMTNGIGEL